MALKNYVEQYAKSFHLTERETEVLYHLVNRIVSPAELGKKLEISLHTVNNHLKKILEKTNSDSKTELLADFLLFLERQKLQPDMPPIRPKVLILDDETDLTKMLQHFFASRNIDSYIYNDPLLALDAILDPSLLRGARDVHELHANVPAVGAAQDAQDLPHGRRLEPQHAVDEDRPVEVGIREAVGLGL